MRPAPTTTHCSYAIFDIDIRSQAWRKATKRDQRNPPSGRRSEWYLLSSHGIVLVFIAANPDCTIQESSARMIQIRREGRTHHYTVNVDFQLPHAAFGGRSMLDMVKSLMEPLPGSPKQ